MSEAASAGAILRCPRCRGAVESVQERLECQGCGATFPVVLGIPDLRVYPDPYADFDADREKALRLAERAATTDFEGLVRYYWEITPGTPPDRAARYAAYAARGEQRARSVLSYLPTAAPHERLLDLGTGTGGALAAAADRFASTVGVDLALRWLVVARKRLEQRRAPARLVCACADRLPFADGSFDAILGIDLLQHTGDPRRVLHETSRVLDSGGTAVFTTTNRFSLWADPHTGLVGTGFLSPRWRKRYVVWRGRSFDPNVRPPSLAEAIAWAREAFRIVEPFLVPIGPSEIASLPKRERRLAAAYERARKAPILRGLLVRFGPIFGLRCRGPRKGSA